MSVECGGPDLRPPTRTELPLCRNVCVCCMWRVRGWRSPPALDLISFFFFFFSRDQNIASHSAGFSPKLGWVGRRSWNETVVFGFTNILSLDYCFGEHIPTQKKLICTISLMYMCPFFQVQRGKLYGICLLGFCLLSCSANQNICLHV